MRITLESISTCVQYPHVFGVLSEFERNLIKERTRAGLEAARGRQGGRPEKLSDEHKELVKTLYSNKK
ncbi:TPA: transposase, partial [Legionella pneumophila subsp. pneumophila]|nr:transposase [Legionella pneumophila subsp. pneumophila]